MQEYDFVPAIGMKSKRFWKEVRELTKKHDADNILAYMMHMLDKAQAAEVPVRKENFVDFGRSVFLFEGVNGWFDRINAYGKKQGFKVKHYIISSGIREMIEATDIAKKFSAIYASTDDQHIVAPAVVGAGVGVVEGAAAEFAVADQGNALRPGFAVGGGHVEIGEKSQQGGGQVPHIVIIPAGVGQVTLFIVRVPSTDVRLRHHGF